MIVYSVWSGACERKTYSFLEQYVSFRKLDKDSILYRIISESEPQVEYYDAEEWMASEE